MSHFSYKLSCYSLIRQQKSGCCFFFLSGYWETKEKTNKIQLFMNSAQELILYFRRIDKEKYISIKTYLAEN